MTNNQTLEDLLLVETSRRNTDLIADLVFKKHEVFDELITIYLRNEEPVSRRAAWVVDAVSREIPELIKAEHLEKITEKLGIFSHDGLKRHSLCILARSPLPVTQTGVLINTCFDWLLSPKEPVAVKVWCMEILYRISLTEPEIRKELADSIEWRMEEETPGFRNRGMKILRKLRKHDSAT
ncbi:MAG: hypothetical protein NTX61_13220 [Bacteroidetes bacterium]|nr:hypothetical protein [Bacteroidota bacterium]